MTTETTPEDELLSELHGIAAETIAKICAPFRAHERAAVRDHNRTMEKLISCRAALAELERKSAWIETVIAWGDESSDHGREYLDISDPDCRPDLKAVMEWSAALSRARSALAAGGGE